MYIYIYNIYVKYGFVESQERRIILRVRSDKAGSVMTQKNFIILFVHEPWPKNSSKEV